MSSEDVDAWFAEYDNPMADMVQRVRSIILAADTRISESIKWKSPTFSFEGNLASFNPRSKKHVSLMFHTGAHIPGHHPDLTGTGDTARTMKFLDDADIDAKTPALQAIVRQWCDWKS